MATIALPGDGSGYQVDASHLRALATLADQIGQDVASLAAKVSAALSAGAAGGLQIGTAIEQAESGWNAQLRTLAGDASGIGSRLNSSATAYSQTEDSVLESMLLRANNTELTL